MSKYHSDLVRDIDAYLKRSGMSEVTFGRKAMGDPHFVRDIRGTRLLRPETEDRARSFLIRVTTDNQSSPALAAPRSASAANARRAVSPPTEAARRATG